MGGGCGSVGKVVASDIRDLRFGYSHQQMLFYINCVEKMKI